MLPPSTVTDWVIALATSTRPAPCSGTVSAGLALAEAISAALSTPGAQSGCSWARIAADPAMCGVAIEVPDSVVYASPGSPRNPSLLFAAVMSTPGAVISGLTAPSPDRGPRLENSASWSLLSTAPTASAASAVAGELTG